MTSDKNKQLITEHLQLSWNEGKFDELREIVLPDFFYQTTFSDDILHLEQYIKFIQLFRNAIPELSVDVEEIMCEGNRVMSHVSFGGAVKEPILGIPASDKIITLPAVSFWNIKHNKIARLETLIDISGVERQLGTSISPKPSLINALKDQQIWSASAYAINFK